MTAADKGEFIKKNGCYVSAPEGASMWPFIRGNRDLVTMLPVNRPLRKYDVILYKNPAGRHVIHRILKVGRDGYLVRGDNCFYDEHVKDGEIFAVLETVLRNGSKERRQTKPYLLLVRLWRFLYFPRKAFRALHVFGARVKRKLLSKQK